MKIIVQQHSWSKSGDKISFIKALRELSGWDLKESKDFADKVGTQTVEHTFYPFEITDPKKFLRTCGQLGINVNAGTNKEMLEPYEQQLKEIASLAILSGHYIIAEDVLNLIRRYSYGSDE